MAKLRRNHNSAGGGAASGTITRTIVAIVIMLGTLFAGRSVFSDLFSDAEPEPVVVTDVDTNGGYLPTSSTRQIVGHQHFALSYSEADEQAEWVAYVLTKEQLDADRFPRTDWFSADPAIRTKSAEFSDYRGSGYDKGHLVPAADRAFSEAAMEETFLMSNISPQVPSFNGGIWRELEELVRDWARRDKKLYVVTGPILSRPKLDKIGRNEVTVPGAYYKVILDLVGDEFKGIGFILNNEVSDQPIMDFAVSIDEVERQTGIDFFPDLLTDDLEAELEGNYQKNKWQTNQKKYQLRVNQWNRRARDNK